MNEMLILVPTRGRPQSVQSFMTAWDDASTVHADVLFCLDDDDEKLQEYLKVIVTTGAQYVVAPRMRLGGTLNHHAAIAAASYRYIGFMGDDHRVRTPGWDARFARELKVHGSGMVYGNDLLQGRNLPTAIVMTSDIIRALGYMVPPGIQHMYLDNFWKELGTRAGCLRYLDDVVIEHMHPVAGKAPVDASYEEVWPLMEPDKVRWETFQLNGGLGDAVRRVLELW